MIVAMLKVNKYAIKNALAVLKQVFLVMSLFCQQQLAINSGVPISVKICDFFNDDGN